MELEKKHNEINDIHSHTSGNNAYDRLQIPGIKQASTSRSHHQ
jgi:hypothetical protein